MKKDTILLVGHGSREASGNDEILDFAAQWRLRQPDWRIEVCFIEFSEVTMSVGLARAAEHADRVLVLPLILNAAGHVKMDIPQAIDGARIKFPQTQFLYAPHLTACDPILSILKRRLRKAMQALDMPDPTTTGVIVLGRGSSDRQANGDMAKMARWLMEEGDHELVDLAFTGITYPRIEKVVQRQNMLGMTQIVVLPYYLYNGTLVERIKRQVEHLKTQYPHIRFTASTYFGFEKEVFELLEQRVHDLQHGHQDSKMPCDGCKFRDFAVEHGLGGHHHDDAQHHHHHHEHEHMPVIAIKATAINHHHEHNHGHEHHAHHEHHDHAHTAHPVAG
ncbi:sirohydrochlorin chelatase [Undibacterium sp. Dicai25W]|uniref:sirohydrochlorin chelatase n=1 Tax=Undibacterium sp. Dicai25W TaxID=3413034 RepID=UPI003BF3F437